ncbi:MAG: sulfatase-like hydrolase/transferase, partial [Bacteroidales bacterium]|nr:sulfatase-like hydrolase/transferase [Bacteroidales bacterium]
MKKFLLLASAIFTFAFLFMHSEQANAQKKNVLLLISDDFNYWTNGYYPQVKTPNIDSLAKKGVFFTDASCSSPVCNPSRNAFMSGLNPVTTGILGNGDGHVRDNNIAQHLPYLRTMNEHFTKNGYYTYAGGKIYHPARMGSNDTDQANWSDFTTQGTGSKGGNIYKWSGSSDVKITMSAGDFDLDVEGNAKDRDLAKHFAQQITDYNDSKPFFFACGFFRPHLGFDVHKEYYDRFNLDDLTMPPGYKVDDLNDVDRENSAEYNEIIAEGKEIEVIRAYLACLAYTDDNVGIVMDALENSKHKDSTIVVFFGDHGWHLGEKNRYKKASVWDA